MATPKTTSLPPEINIQIRNQVRFRFPFPQKPTCIRNRFSLRLLLLLVLLMLLELLLLLLRHCRRCQRLSNECNAEANGQRQHGWATQLGLGLGLGLGVDSSGPSEPTDSPSSIKKKEDRIRRFLHYFVHWNFFQMLPSHLVLLMLLLMLLLLPLLLLLLLVEIRKTPMKWNSFCRPLSMWHAACERFPILTDLAPNLVQNLISMAASLRF